MKVCVTSKELTVLYILWVPSLISSLSASQPILADEVQTFKALITIHKVLQEGHPIAVREAQTNTGWLESLARGVSGDGMRGETDKGLISGALDGLYSHRLRAFNKRIRIFPASEAVLPQTASRIQR